jgi:hypothetical protein
MTRTDAERIESWFIALVLAGYSPEQARAEIDAVQSEEAQELLDEAVA